MIRSLKNQLRYVAQYIGITFFTMFASIPYVMLVVYDPVHMEGSLIVVYQVATYMMLWMFCQIYIAMLNSSYFMPALEFGATRKGWLQAMIVSKFIYVVAAVASLLMARSMAELIFKESVALKFPTIPLLLAICFFSTCFSELLGYATARFGLKWLVIGSIGFFLAIVGILVLLVLNNTIDELLVLANSPWLVVGIVAACVPLEYGSWSVIRNIAVKG